LPRRQLAEQRSERQLGAGRVAARIGDAPGAAQAVAEALGLPVGPGGVEAVVGTEIHDHGRRRMPVERRHVRRGRAIGQGQHAGLGPHGCQALRADVGKHEATVFHARHVRADRFAGGAARTHSHEFEPGCLYSRGSSSAPV